ncbi:protoporphyrinogen oxidase [Edaphobacter sp. 12200R-103]|jgi:oxygen-dependent protoporphyrinogen oxidase|uniref:protoporphyrinogen oxidase n=1 Tax=Edaphobacter sp. 12200R-103 TaxID=2703788 RepID=UPI00138CF580|nr:protoporphyrinogen oxidase [Edaphobacter sp. 12200R-103]QHS53023.1 protoporphyrinogen oxidase [Edaphobacter sp. 12200R-103]
MRQPKRIAIIGGGIAGLSAAYELAKLTRHQESADVTLFEASSRLGGIVETIREGGFIIEGGPDGWVTEKPWARELAVELGLEDELIFSKDDQRRTYVLIDGALKAMPNSMRMMVPADLDALDASDLFSDEAKRAFHQEILRDEELKTLAPVEDESVAHFIHRHFGDEVLEKIGAPLLSGVFGGDVAQLSVRAVMAPFVALEREYGSLILGLQARQASGRTSPLFTTLRSGLGTLIDRMVGNIPQQWIHLGVKVTALAREDDRWTLTTSSGRESFDSILMAAPLHVARQLLESVDHKAAALMQMEASSAVVVGFGFEDAAQVPVPEGFGFLVPPGSRSLLLACTFMDHKFPCRVPPGGRLLRAFFGGSSAERVLKCGNDEIASIARMELARILGPLPEPRITIIRRLPLSLPQYAVGHLERMQELQDRIDALQNLYLLGNGYRGVGLPDLVRDSHAAARSALRG